MPRYTFKLHNPDELDVEITVTLTAADKREAFERIGRVDIGETLINSCNEENE